MATFELGYPSVQLNNIWSATVLLFDGGSLQLTPCFDYQWMLHFPRFELTPITIIAFFNLWVRTHGCDRKWVDVFMTLRVLVECQMHDPNVPVSAVLTFSLIC